MQRREFMKLIGGLAGAWPIAARAQQGHKLQRIGFLRVGQPPPSFIEPRRRALAEMGQVEEKI